MYNEPPIVRPPVAPPVQESPYSSPIVVNTTKPTLYVKKKSSDAWAWKTIAVALLLSPVIWYLLGEIAANYVFYSAKSIAPGFYQYNDEFLTKDQLLITAGVHGAMLSAVWTVILECLVCIPLGIFYVVRR